jgi:F0F1-type ATP synthase assembly protein I
MAPTSNSSPSVADLAGMGMYLAAVILLPLLGGVWLDSKWHTAPTFVLIGLFVGLAAGAAGVWLKVRDLSK